MWVVRLSRYFREELKQRIRGKASANAQPTPRPQGVLFSGYPERNFGLIFKGKENGFQDIISLIQVLPGSLTVKSSVWNVGDPSLIPGSGRSPEEGKGYALQYSGLENSMDCIVHWVTKHWTRLSDFHLWFLWVWFSFVWMQIKMTWKHYKHFCNLHFPLFLTR